MPQATYTNPNQLPQTPPSKLDENSINIMLALLEARDPYTLSHSLRVTEIAMLLAQEMNCTPQQMLHIYKASYLHDIGKIGIPDQVLNKRGPLNEQERKDMQAHPRIGYNILYKSSQFQDIAKTVLYHHERWDGAGYPSGKKELEIPVESRIIGVADAYDAITSNRPYRKGQSPEYAYSEIWGHQKEQFCPEVSIAFTTIFPNIPPANAHPQNHHQHVFYGHDELMHSRKLLK